MECAGHQKKKKKDDDCNLSDFIICIDIFNRTQHSPCNRLLSGN